MSITPGLSTAMRALMAQQTGLNVVGHNIANVNTPGYTRQRVVLEPATSHYTTYGAVGQGVNVKKIERIVDEFLNGQLRDADTDASSKQSLQTTYDRLDAVFNELSGNDLSTEFDKFFKSLHDLSANVDNTPTRDLVVMQGQTLSEMINTLSTTLTDYRTTLDDEVVRETGEVNTLLKEIADLNVKIGYHEGVTRSSDNDLRDVRDGKLRDLAKLIDITVNEQLNGSVNISTRGMPLVIFDRTFELTTRLARGEDMPIHQVIFADGESPLMATNGKLVASIQARDEVVKGYLGKLDQLSADFIFQFNRVHSQGVGLTPLTSVTAENEVVDPAVTLDKLDLGFTPKSGTFQITNGSLTIDVVNKSTNEILKYTVPIDLDGIGADMTLNDLATAINAAVPAGTITAAVDTANRLTINANNPDAYGFYFSEDTSGVLATLGINNFFSGHHSASMAVSDTLAGNSEYLATGLTPTVGDSDNLLNLIDLRDAQVANGGTKTLEDFYRSTIDELGTDSSLNQSKLTVSNDLITRLENERENISGVSLDEELTYMIQYQRAYQATARYLSVLDTILDGLINRT